MTPAILPIIFVSLTTTFFRFPHWPFCYPTLYLSFSYPLTTTIFLSPTDPLAILPFSLWSPNYHHFPFPTLTLLPSYLSISYPLTTTFILSQADPPAILPFILWSPNYHLFPLPQWLLSFMLWSPNYHLYPFPGWPSCHSTFHSLIPKLPPFSSSTMTPAFHAVIS